jgi:hypothetical protein
MTLLGNYNLQLNGNVMNPVTLQSTSDAASTYPMITFAGTLKNISLSNVEIYAEASSRKQIIVVDSLNVEKIHFENLRIYSTSALGKTIYISSTQPTEITMLNTAISGNSGVHISHQGSLNMEFVDISIEHAATEEISVGLFYSGKSLSAYNCVFTSNFVSIDAKSDTIMLNSNHFGFDPHSFPPQNYFEHVVLEGDDVRVIGNFFSELIVPVALSLRYVTRYCLIEYNHFIFGRFLHTSGYLGSVIAIDSPETTIIGQKNIFENNEGIKYLVQVTTSTSNGVPRLEWTYNTMFVSKMDKYIVSDIPSDIRYNFWGTTYLPMINDLISMNNTYTINPYLNVPHYTNSSDIIDCVELFGKQVDSMCKYGTCSSVIGLNPSVCSGHGICSLNNTCICDQGYSGKECEDFYCFNKHYKAFDVCNMNQCVGPDKCDCKQKHLQSGDNCQYFTCNGISDKNSTVCSGNGKCVNPNFCDCNNGYFGQNCELWTCGNVTRQRVEFLDPLGCTFKGDSGCNMRGICISYNKCSCTGGYYGQYCEDFNCGGIEKDSPNVCTGRGKCVDINRCECQKGVYEGLNCELAVCFTKSGSLACSGHGTCITPNKCECSAGYTGPECEFPICSKFYR